MGHLASVPEPQPNQPSRQQKGREVIPKRFIILTSVAIFLAYFGYGLAIVINGNLADSANFGESFGAISGLLNGAGLMAAVAAVLLQYNELQETRKEVQVTLEAQKQQATEATRSADAHEQSVSATTLLAKVQSLSALLAYYNSLRAAQIEIMNTLVRELDAKSPGYNQLPRLEIQRELEHEKQQLKAFNGAAL